MRCEIPGSSDLTLNATTLGTICLRHPQIAPHHSLVLSVHLTNYLRLADIVTQVFPFVPSSVTCPVSSWRQPTPQPATTTCIFVPLYIFFTHPFFGFLYEVGGHWLESILVRLRFSPCFASCHSQLLEATRHTQSEVGNLHLEKYRDVFYSAVLLMTHSPTSCFLRRLGSLLHLLYLSNSISENLRPRLRVIDILAPSPSLSFAISLFFDFRNTIYVLPSTSRHLFLYTYMHLVHSLTPFS
jgi:hypothetical protein